MMNIVDAYESKLFNDYYDKLSGYRTKSILTMPILSTAKEGGEAGLLGRHRY